MSVDRVFADTNVLVYLFDDAEPDKQAASQRLLSEALATSQIVVSTQVLQELYVALTRGSEPIASPEVAERAVRDASSLVVVQIDVPLVLDAIATTRQRSLSFWDALIVRAAVSAGCSRLLTEDLNSGESIDGVSVENPFE
jgi:predicted nucleic acid-binding protein